MDAIKNFFSSIHQSIQSKMAAMFTKEELSEFQRNKVVHEFTTFIDLNKDGIVTLNDFEVARKQICELSGWKEGSQRYLHTRQVFADIWRYLQDDGDSNLDGKISRDEWVRMWGKLNKVHLIKSMEKGGGEQVEEKLPDWLERYIEYKFYLFDRTGDGQIDMEEFEYVLGGFGVAPKDARTAFLLFSENHEKKVDMTYFRQLCVDFFYSDDQGALGNFITGRLDFTR